jgi:hypothetical protein
MVYEKNAAKCVDGLVGRGRKTRETAEPKSNSNQEGEIGKEDGCRQTVREAWVNNILSLEKPRSGALADQATLNPNA